MKNTEIKMMNERRRQMMSSRSFIKTNSRVLALLLTIVLLLSLSLGGTMAYLIAQSRSVDNIFTPTLKPTVNMTVEKKVVDINGNPITPMDGSEPMKFMFQVKLPGCAGMTFKTSAEDLVLDEYGAGLLEIPANSQVTIYNLDAQYINSLADNKVIVTELLLNAFPGFSVKMDSEIRVSATDDPANPQAPYKEVVLRDDTAASVSFTNIYEAENAAMNYEIQGFKDFSGRPWMDGDKFTFELVYYAPGSSTPISLGTKSVVYDSSVPSYASFDFTAEVKAIAFQTTGIYRFEMKEVEGAIGGVSYQSDVAKFEIEVTDTDFDGKLEISKYSTTTNNMVQIFDDEVPGRVLVTFKNNYAPAGSCEAYINIQKNLNDTTGQITDLRGFEFAVTSDDGETYPNIVTDSTGRNQLKLVYELADLGKVYHYTVTEVDQGMAGMHYDPKVYDLYVHVLDNLDGTVKAVISDDPSATPALSGSNSYTAAFTNTYDPAKPTLSIPGDKDLNGRAMENGEFTFELYLTNSSFALTSGQTPAATTVNGAEGAFSFDISSYLTKPGKVYFLIKEQIPSKTYGVKYDESVYHVVVDVQDAGGTLTATTTVTNAKTGQPSEVKFINSYVAKGSSISLAGTKTLKNKTLADKAFAFQLFNANESFQQVGSPIETVRNNAQGKFSFSALDFTKAGTYRYIIKEDSSAPLLGVSYDSTVYQLTVTVTDNLKGQLETAMEMKAVNNGEAKTVNKITFENVYSAANANLILGGKKILNGMTLTDGMFTFHVYAADESFQPQGAALKTTTNKADGFFVFDALPISEVGTFHYLVVEDDSDPMDRVTYDDTAYGVTVVVSDNGQGQLIMTRSITKLGAGAAEQMIFENTYTPKPGDIGVNIHVLKTVKNVGTESIGPENFQFTLTSKDAGTASVVKSDKDGKAQFRLTFTEEDIGKTYTYTLAEKDTGVKHVTYSAQVYELKIYISLSEDNQLVATVTNNGTEVKDFVAKFENIYDHDKPIDEPVDPEIPETGDQFDLYLMLLIAAVSLIVLIKLVLLKRRIRSR